MAGGRSRQKAAKAKAQDRAPSSAAPQAKRHCADQGTEHYAAHFASAWLTFVPLLVTLLQEHLQSLTETIGAPARALSNRHTVERVTTLILELLALWDRHAEGWYTGKVAEKIATLLPLSTRVTGYTLTSAESVKEVGFQNELRKATLELQGCPWRVDDFSETQTLYGRLGCYNPSRPQGAKWLCKGIIDYCMTECHSLEAATQAVRGPCDFITFLVYDQKMLTEVPKGSMTRFNIQKRTVRTWEWNEELHDWDEKEKICYSATNVAVAQ